MAELTINKEAQKEVAVKLLEELNIYKPYVRGFKAKKQSVCLYDRYAGFWTWQYPALEAKIKQVEEEYGCMVYAVCYNKTQFGELYSMLIVSGYENEWNRCLYKDNGYYTAFAYIWNKTDDWCSEFGNVGIKSYGGGLQRIY